MSHWRKRREPRASYADVWAIALIVLIVLACMVWTVAAIAQHNHAAGHSYYQSWFNKSGFNCCNDRDCGELAEQDERNTPTGIEEIGRAHV